VRNVQSLRDYVETQKVIEPEGTVGSNASDAEDDAPDVLRESPVVGDGKYKLEIGRFCVGPDVYYSLN
jgi:hypothetical protein